MSQVGSGSCADGARGGGCRLPAPQRQIQAPTSLLLPAADSLLRRVGLAGRKQACWLGPPPHLRGWRRSRRGLPWARLPPTEATWCWSSGGCFPNLPAWPPPTLYGLWVQVRWSSDRPCPPWIPKTPVFGPKKWGPGSAPPHPDCDTSLRKLSPKVTSSPTFKRGVLLPPSSGPSPGRPFLQEHGRAPPSLAPISWFGNQVKCGGPPAPPCHQCPLGL